MEVPQSLPRRALSFLRNKLPCWDRLQAAVFFFSTSYFLLLIYSFRRFSLDGTRFQDWSSDTMMQTLPIQPLHDTPFKTLWYLHIDPPFLDTLRALLAGFLYPHLSGKGLLDHVDWAMYNVHALFFGLFSLLIFTWSRRFLGEKIALILAAFWIFHPAPLVFGTLLDLTFISSFLICWFFYEFFRLEKEDGGIGKLALATVALYLARSVFQWYFVFAVALALLIRGVKRRDILRYICLCAIVVVPYTIKQYSYFGTTSTSTFLGLHKTGVINYAPTADEIEAEKKTLDFSYPSAAEKYSGYKLNTKQMAEKNLIFSRLALKKYRQNWPWTLRQFHEAYKFNVGKYWKPSSRYILQHPIRDRLFWSGLYDRALSSAVLSQAIQECLIILLIMLVALRTDRPFVRTALSYGPPVVLIFVSTLFGNQFDWTEVDRLKFFLEPEMYLFISWVLLRCVQLSGTLPRLRTASVRSIDASV